MSSECITLLKTHSPTTGFCQQQKWQNKWYKLRQKNAPSLDAGQYGVWQLKQMINMILNTNSFYIFRVPRGGLNSIFTVLLLHILIYLSVLSFFFAVSWYHWMIKSVLHWPDLCLLMLSLWMILFSIYHSSKTRHNKIVFATLHHFLVLFHATIKVNMVASYFVQEWQQTSTLAL